MLEMVVGLGFWLIGFVAGAFCIIQSLIVLRVGIPLTSRLGRKGLLKNASKMNAGNVFSVLFFIVIYFIVQVLVNRLASQVNYYSFLVGVGMAFVFGIFKTGMNSTNIHEYFTSNLRHFTDVRGVGMDLFGFDVDTLIDSQN